MHSRLPMTKWLNAAAVLVGGLCGFGGQAWAQSDQVSIDEIAAPARATIEAQSKSRPLQSLVRHTVDGSVHYDAKFRTRTEGQVVLSVDEQGRVLGRANRQDQPSGTGP